MELLLIRHGESEADLLNVHEGRADFPLTEKGFNQAKKMAQYVAEHFPPSIIMASPLKRAKTTAMVLQEAVGCKIIFKDDLMEYNNGVLAGLSREEAIQKFPIPVGGRPKHVPIKGGESELEFRYRTEITWSQILSDYNDLERIAIISHGGTISNLIKSILSIPVENQLVFPTGDTGMHLIEMKDNKKIIRFLNNQNHLITE